MRKKVSRTEVAKEAGVAESTVSRALNDSTLITDTVKLRVKEVAARLGYIPNRHAVLLASNRTMRIGLVVKTYKSFPPFSRSYFHRLLDGVLQKAEELGYSITIVLDRKNDKFKELGELIYSREVDGLIFAVAPLDDERFPSLVSQNIPFVMINNYYKDSDCINCDPYDGTLEALIHLEALGHNSIGYITGDGNYWDGKKRLEVFNCLAEKHGISTVVTEGNFSRRSGFEGAKNLLRSGKGPTAIMTGSDRCALGVIEYCKETGLNIPEHVSLVGFDNLGPARDAVPGLSTIHNPVVNMGAEAVVLLDRRLNNPDEKPASLLIGSTFIERQSTGIRKSG